MTNLEFLRALPAEKLAEYLVGTMTELEYPDSDDYGIGDVFTMMPFEYETYRAPDGSTYWDLSDAIKYTTEWLSEESGMMEVI